MPKVKESLTIDKDISDWIRSIGKERYEGSTSAFVNEVLKERMSMDIDYYNSLKKLDFEIEKKEKQKYELLEKIKMNIEEGNKQEREMAEKEMERQKESIRHIQERLKKCIQRLKDLNLVNRFIEIKDDDEKLFELSKEIYRINVSEGRPISDSVGLVDFKRLRDWIINNSLEVC